MPHTSFGTGSVRADEDGHCGERVAASYDESAAEMFESGVEELAVDVLADLAGSAVP